MKSLKKSKLLQDTGITEFIQKGSLDGFSAYRKKNSNFFHQEFHFYSLSVQWQMNYTTKRLGASPQTP